MPDLSGATVAALFSCRRIRDVRRSICVAIFALALLDSPAVVAGESDQREESKGSATYLETLPKESMLAIDNLLRQFSAASACDALNADMLVYFSRRMGVLIAGAAQGLDHDHPEQSAEEIQRSIFSTFDERADEHYEAAFGKGCDHEEVKALIHQFRVDAQAAEAMTK